VKHVKALTRKPALAADEGAPDLAFIVSSLQLSLTVLQALQTKKATQTSQ